MVRKAGEILDGERTNFLQKYKTIERVLILKWKHLCTFGLLDKTRTIKGLVVCKTSHLPGVGSSVKIFDKELIWTSVHSGQ